MMGTAASAPPKIMVSKYSQVCLRLLYDLKADGVVVWCNRGDVLGRSAWAAYSMTRDARVDELEELKRAGVEVRRTRAMEAMGTRVARRANILLVCVMCCVWL
jgi:hypothetical protein